MCGAALRGGAHLDLAVVLRPVVQALGVLALGELPADVRPVVEQLDHALGGEAELELSEKCRALIGQTYLTASNSLLQSGGRTIYEAGFGMLCFTGEENESTSP